MKLIIAGSRTLEPNVGLIEMLIRHFGIWPEEVVSGTAAGMDQAGERWACGRVKVNIRRFPADWSKGRGAGFVRNAEMAEYADALLLIWDGESKGSAHMKAEMERRKKDVYEVILRSHTWGEV